MADDDLLVSDEQCEVEAGGCDEGQSGELTSEAGSGPVVGQDSQLGNEDSTNDEMEILSPEGTDQVASNEAILESTQSTYSQEFESENADPAGRERSQFAAVDGWFRARAMIVPQRFCRRARAGEARGRVGPSLPAAASQDSNACRSLGRNTADRRKRRRHRGR